MENQFRTPDIRERQTKNVDDGKRKKVDVEAVSIEKVTLALTRVLNTIYNKFLLKYYLFLKRIFKVKNLYIHNYNLARCDAFYNFSNLFYIKIATFSFSCILHSINLNQ